MSAICPTLQNWHVRKPNVSHFDIFGSKAFIHIPELIRGKQFPKGREVTFLGYSELFKGYRVLIPSLSLYTISHKNHKEKAQNEPIDMGHRIC
jgi:hypothetical protein